MEKNLIIHDTTATIPVNQTYLERPRINQLLEKAIQSRVVTVVAEGGCGKTRAVCSFLQNYHAAAIWLRFSGWYTASAEDADEPVPDHFLQANPEAVLVLDDLHLYREETAVDFFEHILSMGFPNLRIVLISRSDPADRILRLFSKGGVAKITGEDLRFNEAEIRNYMLIRNIGVSQEMVSEIYRDTEGWAIAVHLVSQTLMISHANKTYSRSAAWANIFRFIETEIFQGLPDDLQKFLVKLSLIDTWPAELLGELCTAPGLIEKMKRTSFFIRYDAAVKAYGMHNMFLKFLREKQGSLTGEEKREFYGKTAQWYLKNGMQEDALIYLEKAGDYSKIIDFVYAFPRNMPRDLVSRLLELSEGPETGTAWLSQKTAYEFIRTVIRPRLLIILERFDDATTEIRETIARYEAMPSSPMGKIILYYAYRLLGLLSLFSSIYTKRCDFDMFFERAQDYYIQISDLPKESFEYVVTKIPSYTDIGPYICRVGYPAEEDEIQNFIEALARTIPVLGNSMGDAFYGLDDLAWAEFAFYQGDLIRSEVFAQRAIRKAREKKRCETENHALFYLIRISLAAGRQEQTEDLLKQLDEEYIQGDAPDRRAVYDIFRGWFYIHLGQGRRIAPWLKTDIDKNYMPPIIHGLDMMVRAKYFYGEKRCPLALAILENQLEPNALGAFLFGRIEMKVLEALCLYREKKREAAFRAFDAAYRMAESNALDMPFIELGKDMRTLVSWAVKYENCGIPAGWLEQIRRKSTAYAKKLFVFAEEYRKRGYVKDSSALSPRELAVLTCLSRGLTREEIARDQSISINTVKSAVKRVYYKLSAVNQADAVRIATGLGILQNNENS
ncbi:LuxR C-terminal-related transcriptional regulator [Treponema primitia]|uniref:LuxR C-terminal-related transcriptional regulator n=1 Tax=Treponema primitia TaxID=88058 RepID=UPI0002555237|nr:LuxR C-terminal-related transcriptional regulator [Treponema primitia]